MSEKGSRKRSSLCGKNEYKHTNTSAGTKYLYVATSNPKDCPPGSGTHSQRAVREQDNAPNGTNTNDVHIARGSADVKYQCQGDVPVTQHTYSISDRVRHSVAIWSAFTVL